MEQHYSQSDLKNTYEPILDHIQTKRIIQKYALNTSDVRDVALDGLDLGNISNVLDLGCGYGFFTEKLADRLKENATIVGLDIIDKNNRDAFLETTGGIGYTGRFLQSDADVICEMNDSSYDLIIASYSLYFFPHLIPDIARILCKDGVFVAVTHSRYSLREVTQFVPVCMNMLGISPPEEIMINKLLQSFSLENGEITLGPYFNKVERIIYKNDLLFPLDQVNDCIDYLDKKRYLIFKDVSDHYPHKVDDMLSVFNRMVYEHAQLHGEVVISKDDAVFRCFLPHSGEFMS